jgi:general secretion pathway protein F/type IV pilus assembly protein PilC
MLYRYRALDKNGDRQKGVIEAASKAEAAAKLQAKGLLYESLKPASEPLFSRLGKRRKSTIDPQLLSRISRDLAIYLKSGISIVNAIRLAASQYAKDRKLSGFFAALATLLDEGKSFSQALELQSVYEIPPFYRQSIRISEDGGMLEEVLDELSRFIKELSSIKKQAKNALFYPAFIIIVSFLMVIFMVTVVVPQITGMFEQLGQELPPITQFVIGVSEFMQSWWMVIVALIAAALVLHTMLLRLSRGYLYGAHRLVLAIPLLGRIVMTTELARFAYMGSVLMRSGVPFVQTIRLAAAVQSNRVLSERFLKAAERVVEGGRFSVALQQGGGSLDPAFVQAIALGEETSELEQILANLSNLYFEENRDRIGVMLSLLEPVMMLIVGGVVGFIVTAMLLPIFSMNIGM